MNLKRAAKMSDLTRLMSEEAAKVETQETSGPSFYAVEIGNMIHDSIARELRGTRMIPYTDEGLPPLMQALVDVMAERYSELWSQVERIQDEQSLNVTFNDGEWSLAR